MHNAAISYIGNPRERWRQETGNPRRLNDLGFIYTPVGFQRMQNLYLSLHTERGPAGPQGTKLSIISYNQKLFIQTFLYHFRNIFKKHSSKEIK